MEINFVEMFCGVGGFKDLNISSIFYGICGFTNMKKGFKFPPYSKLKKDFPKDVLEDMYEQKRMTLMEITEELSSTYKHIRRLFQCYDIPRRVAKKRDQRLEKNDSWKGGVIMRHGYIEVRCEGHPRAKKAGFYVPKQVLVMEASLGRYLTDDELVHHINGIKTDNRLENLQLMTKSGKRSHVGLHNRLRGR